MRPPRLTAPLRSIRCFSVASLSALAVAASMGSVVLLGACGPKGGTTETHVARQDLYKTSNFTYDEFFEDVFNLQKESTKAVQSEKQARSPLIEKTEGGGAAAEGPIDPLVDLVKHRAEQLASDKKIKLRLG